MKVARELLNNYDNSKNRTAAHEYMDLLACALTEHEKNLDNLIERLRIILETFEKDSRHNMSKRLSGTETKNDPNQETFEEGLPKTVAYIKIVKY